MSGKSGIEYSNACVSVKHHPGNHPNCHPKSPSPRLPLISSQRSAFRCFTENLDSSLCFSLTYRKRVDLQTVIENVEPEIYSSRKLYSFRYATVISLHWLDYTQAKLSTVAWSLAGNYVCMIYLIPLRLDGINSISVKVPDELGHIWSLCLSGLFLISLNGRAQWLMNEHRIDHSEAIFLPKDGNLMGKMQIRLTNWAE